MLLVSRSNYIILIVSWLYWPNLQFQTPQLEPGQLAVWQESEHGLQSFTMGAWACLNLEEEKKTN